MNDLNDPAQLYAMADTISKSAREKERAAANLQREASRLRRTAKRLRNKARHAPIEGDLDDAPVRC